MLTWLLAKFMSLSLWYSVSCLSIEGYFLFLDFLTWVLHQRQARTKALTYEDGVTNVEKSLNKCSVTLTYFKGEKQVTGPTCTLGEKGT